MVAVEQQQRSSPAWSAADEAATRVSAVRKVLEDGTKIPAAPHTAAASWSRPQDQRELRQGLSELDAVRQFLHEHINTSNRAFLSSGDRDENLHGALQHGLAELEDVRSRLVRTLSGSLSGSGSGAAPRPTSAATKRGSGDAEASGSTKMPNVTATTTASVQEQAKRLFRGQRPASATVRSGSTSAAANSGESIHGSFEGLRSTASRINSRPMSATRPAAAPPKAPSDVRFQGTKLDDAKGPAAPTGPSVMRSRPTSAPARPAPSNAEQPDATGGDSASQQWAKYQDWAQKVMTSVQSRRVMKHRQALEKERSNSFTSNDSGPTTPAAAAAAAPHPPPPPSQTNTAAADTKPPPARPTSAAFSSLRRAQQAAAAQQPTAGTTTTTAAAPSRPTSATLRSGATHGSGGGLDATAQNFREQGNVAFQQKRFADAADFYGRALALEPHSELLYCNRAAANLMLSRFHAALADAQAAIEIDPMHVKAHWRAAKACLYLGQTDQARSFYSQAQKLADSPADKDAIAAESRAADLVDKCRRCVRLREYTEAIKAADQVLEVFPPSGPCSLPWQCLRTEAVLHVDAADALAQATKFTTEDPTCAEAWYLRAKAVFYTGHDAASTNSAVSFLQRCQEVDPKHSRAPVLRSSIETFAVLRDQGNGGYAAGRWQEAYVAYTKCLAVDPYNTSLKAIILCNRSAVCIQCERWKDALDDITQSINCNPQNAKAYTRRARIYQQQGNMEAAIKDLQLAVQMYPSTDNQERLQQAIEARNRQQRPTSAAAPPTGGAQSSSFRFFSFAGSARPSTAGASRPGGAAGGQGTASRPQSASQSRPGANPYAIPKPAVPQGPNHYEVLGVPRNADDKALTRAYRDAALKWHPDKWMTASNDEKTQAEEMFKHISTAYSVLRDATKRRQYDVSL